MHTSEAASTNYRCMKIGVKNTRMATPDGVNVPETTELLAQLAEASQTDVVLPYVMFALLEAWPHVADKAYTQMDVKDEMVSGSRELVSKFIKFLTPAVKSMVRLKVSSEDYDIPFLYKLTEVEQTNLTSGAMSLYDICRDKTFGCRIADKRIMRTMDDTAIGLGQLDPNKTRKISQSYLNRPPNHRERMSSKVVCMRNVVATGSPDWDLTSWSNFDTGIDARARGWSQEEIDDFSSKTMLSPLAVALTWMQDKTDSLANMFYFDSYKNNGGLNSESYNKSGSAIKVMRNAFDVVNLATWQHGGSPTEGTPNHKTWEGRSMCTIDELHRVIAAVSLLIQKQPEHVVAAFSTFYPQTTTDPTGVGLSFAAVPLAGEEEVNDPSWPPGITATLESLQARLAYGTFAHCTRILGEDIEEVLLAQRTAGTAACTSVDDSRFTHMSLAHTRDGAAAPLVNPSEILELTPPWDNPSLFDKRHAMVVEEATSGWRHVRGATRGATRGAASNATRSSRGPSGDRWSDQRR